MKGKTTSNILHFSIAVIVSKIIGATITFCVAKILIPSEYGIWSTLTLIISLSSILCFGTVETLVKQVPYYLGESNNEMVKKIDGGVLASIFFSSGVLLFFSFFFIFSSFGFVNRSLVHYVQITLITAAVSLFTCFFYYRLSAFSCFKEVSILNSSRAFITFFIVIMLGWKWHLTGMIVGGLLVEIALLALSIILNKRLNRSVFLLFDISLLWDLIKIGFPITMVWWVYMVMTSIGRIISISMLGKTATGYYSLGVSIVSLIIVVPAAIGQVLYPQVSEKVGGKASQESISRYVVFPTQIMNMIIPLVLGILMFVTPFALNTYFPKYIPGILSTQILLCGAFFGCSIKNGVNYLVAIDEQNKVFVYVLISLLINVFVAIIAVKMNYYIQGIAVGTVTASLVLTTLIWKSVFKNMGYSFMNQLKMIVELYAPFFLTVGIILLLISIVNRYTGSITIKPIINIPIFTALYLLAITTIPFLRSWCDTLWQELKVRK